MAAVYGGLVTYAVPQMLQHLGDAALFLFSYPHYTKLFQNCNPRSGPIGPDPLTIATVYGKIRSTHNVYVYHLPLLCNTTSNVIPIIFIFISNHYNGATKATLNP